MSELISLKVSDLNLQFGYVICHDTDRERIIPIGNVSKRALVDYMEHGRGYFVKNILKKNKKKFLPGNFYQFLYKLVYVGYKIENGEKLKMYQLKEVAFFESV